MSAWCGWRDSNPHNFRHWNLNPARLPVPPHPLGASSPAAMPRAAAYSMALPAQQKNGLFRMSTRLNVRWTHGAKMVRIGPMASLFRCSIDAPCSPDWALLRWKQGFPPQPWRKPAVHLPFPREPTAWCCARAAWPRRSGLSQARTSGRIAVRPSRWRSATISPRRLQCTAGESTGAPRASPCSPAPACRRGKRELPTSTAPCGHFPVRPRPPE